MTMRDLEKRVWYRFLKIVYIFSAIFLVLIAFAWAWTAKPENVVDYARITCSNGYSVNSNDIGVSFISETIFPSDDEKIRLYCVTNPDQLEGVQKALKLGISLEAIRERLYPVGTTITNEQFENLTGETKIISDGGALFDPIAEGGTLLTQQEIQEMDLVIGLPVDNVDKNYDVEYIYRTQGNWTNFLLTFVSISFFGFLFIEVIGRTLLYIVAGKSFFSKNF